MDDSAVAVALRGFNPRPPLPRPMAFRSARDVTGIVRVLLVLVFGTVGLALSGCAKTDVKTVSAFDYRLPRTDAIVTVTMTLSDCSTFMMNADATIAPQAGAQDTVYRIDPASLASNHIKRTLKLSRNSNGVLTGINSANADQSPQMVASVVKVAAQVATALAATTPTAMTCNDVTSARVSRASAIAAQLRAWREAGAPSKGAGSLDLTALSKELLDLKTALTISVAVPVAIDADEHAAAADHFVKFPEAPFRALFQSLSQDVLGNIYKIKWSVERDALTTVVEQADKAGKTNRACGFSLRTPLAVPATLAVTGKGQSITAFSETAPIAVGQWGADSLCIDAGFGENHEIDVTYDDYGQTKEASWTSEATAASILSAAASGASDATSLGKSAFPSQLDRIKASNDEMDAEQKHVKYEACKQVLAAGGTCS